MNTIFNKINYLLSVIVLILIIASLPAHSEALQNINSNFVSVSAGENHTCGLTSNGQVYCWGDGSVGQLGSGTAESSLRPVAVEGGLRFNSINVGWDHTCGITSEGEAYCWGRGRYGRLGNGSAENQLVPTAVTGGLSFTSVNPGLLHTCGITTEGDAYCWGRGADGRLGYDSIESSLVPVQVAGDLKWGSINAASATTCGIDTGGNAYCWGSGDFGNLLGQGEDDRGGKQVPGAVAGGFTFAPESISVGTDHTCALTPDGEAVCWGRGRYGKLGIGSSESLGVIENLRIPREVIGGISFSMITTGVFQTCGIDTDGKAYCWGRNSSGQLGDGTTTMRTEPVAVSGGMTFTDITIGSKHACGITTNNEVYCWGDGASGKLGTRSSDNILTPTRVVMR
jgi:alpha-tubulin suppressor-like RCC1 family protein